MFFSDWEVLLVDDEPEVLIISELVMKNFEVYGLPLKLHTAQSKAEAIELLKANSKRFGIAVAIIDVVMESDLAGLELCQYARNELGDELIQLFIRTGQPGIAAERDVIEHYDINGYFTKAETTGDKLFSMVKSGIRQYFWSALSLSTMRLLSDGIASGNTHDKIVDIVQRTIRMSPSDIAVPRYIRVGDTVLTEVGWGQESPSQIIEILERNPGVRINHHGDMVFMHETGLRYLKLVSLPNRAPLDTLFKSTINPPKEITSIFSRMLNGIAYLWHQAT